MKHPTITVIIPRKEPGTGDSLDLASEYYDREIVFDKGRDIAVVVPARFGGEAVMHYSTPWDHLKLYEKRIPLLKDMRWVRCSVDSFLNQGYGAVYIVSIAGHKRIHRTAPLTLVASGWQPPMIMRCGIGATYRCCVDKQVNKKSA